MKKGVYLLNIFIQTSVFLSVFLSFAQVSKKEYANWFDQKVGLENTALYNGYLDGGDGNIEWNNSYKGTHRYFNDFNFFNGSLVYENQEYNNIQMKYDIFTDELLFGLKSIQNTLLMVRPIKSRISSFEMDDHHFVNLDQFDVSDPLVTGFAEVLYKSPSFTLLKKYKKNRWEKNNKERVLFKFKENNFNFLYYKDSFNRLNRQKDFIRLFPEFKKSISKHLAKKSFTENDMIKFLKEVQFLMNAKASGK